MSVLLRSTVPAVAFSYSQRVGKIWCVGRLKVVSTATEEREPEAVLADSAADDADDNMATIDVGRIGAKPLAAKHVPKLSAAAPITPDQQASLSAHSMSLLNNFSRSHFIMASNILDPTSWVKQLDVHHPFRPPSNASSPVSTSLCAARVSLRCDSFASILFGLCGNYQDQAK